MPEPLLPLVVYGFAGYQLAEWPNRTSTLLRGGKVVNMGARHGAILLALAKAWQRPLTTAQLSEEVWTTKATHGAVQAAISRLNTAKWADQHLVASDPGQRKAYRLNADVVKLEPKDFHIPTAAIESASDAARERDVLDLVARFEQQLIDVTARGPRQKEEVLHEIAKVVAMANVMRAVNPIEAIKRLALAAEQYYKLAQVRLAEIEFRKLVEWIRKAALSGSAEDAKARYGLAKSLVGLSEPAQAKPVMDHADRVARGLRSPDLTVELAAARCNAVYFANIENYPLALQYAMKMVALADVIFPDSLHERFLSRRALAEIGFRTGSLDALKAAVEELLNESFTPMSVGEIAFARAQIHAARLRAAQRDLSSAETILLNARNVLIARLGDDDPSVGYVDEDLALAYQAQGKFELARAAYSEACRISKLTTEEENPQALNLQLSAVLVGCNNGEQEAVIKAIHRARPWFVKHFGSQKAPMVQVMDFRLARAILDLGGTEDVRIILSRLKPDLLSLSEPMEPWFDRLQAEQGRLHLLSGNVEKGLPMLSGAYQRLKEAGETELEINRYAALIVQMRGALP